MKKITISVALLLGSIVTKAQIPEYIDVSTKGIFGKSEMVLYCESMEYDDLQYFSIGRNNDNYHWAKYVGANQVVISMNDNEGDTRELCTQQDDNQEECNVVDAFATEYKFVANGEVFQVWISKINVK
tara:strand:- start:378 stop:761 length:384 start_codon:yes stop_codon:yes gene_type:complete